MRGAGGDARDPGRATRAGEPGRRPARSTPRCSRRPPGCARPAAPPPPALAVLPPAPPPEATETTAREEGKVTPGTSAGISPGAVMTPSRGATKRRSLRSDVRAAALSVRKWPPHPRRRRSSRPAAASCTNPLGPSCKSNAPSRPEATCAAGKGRAGPLPASLPGGTFGLGRALGEKRPRGGSRGAGEQPRAGSAPALAPRQFWKLCITSVTGSHPARKAARNQQTNACGRPPESARGQPPAPSRSLGGGAAVAPAPRALCGAPAARARWAGRPRLRRPSPGPPQRCWDR